MWPSLLAALAAGLLPPSCASSRLASKPDLALFPAAGAVEGCRPTEDPAAFVGRDLYKMIDGGAGRFLSRGFEWAAKTDYECQSGGRVSVEIYRMKSSAAARALFDEALSGFGESVHVGEASRASTHLVEFYRSELYVAVIAFEEGQAGRTASLAVARGVDAHVAPVR